THHWFTHVPARHRIGLPKSKFQPGEAFRLDWETDFAKVARSRVLLFRGGRSMAMYAVSGETPNYAGSGSFQAAAPKLPGTYEAVLYNLGTKVATTRFSVLGKLPGLLIRKLRYAPKETIHVEYVIDGPGTILLIDSSQRHVTLHADRGPRLKPNATFRIPATREARTAAGHHMRFEAPLAEGWFDVRLYSNGHEVASKKISIKEPTVEVDTSVDLQQAPTTWLMHAGFDYTFKMTMRVFGTHLWGKLEGLNNDNPVTLLKGTAHHNILEFVRGKGESTPQLYVGSAYKTRRGWRVQGSFVWQGQTYAWRARNWIELPDPKKWDGDCDLDAPR
ncbi:MAG: hypothetical protein OER88_07830, partial [Planctomycetota bacterium]|nr:hypothetical protein [Planctomycetota bacterium]